MDGSHLCPFCDLLWGFAGCANGRCEEQYFLICAQCEKKEARITGHLCLMCNKVWSPVGCITTGKKRCDKAARICPACRTAGFGDAWFYVDAAYQNRDNVVSTDEPKKDGWW